MKEDDTGFPDNEAAIYTEEEREAMKIRIDVSILADYDGSRRKYADQVSRSQVLVKKVRAKLNGHS